MIAVSILFGLAFGIYELVLPFFLEDRGISDIGQGYIFGVGAVLPFALRILVGRWSDLSGRKVFYAISLLLCGAANFLTPIASAGWLQAVLKGTRETAVEIRKTLHPILLYESSRTRFLDFMGKTSGLERLFEALGYPIGGLVPALTLTWIVIDRFTLSFVISGSLLCTALLIFAFIYDESGIVRPPSSSQRDLFSLRLNKQLYIIILSSLIFNVGLSCSHCFVMPLFFARRFGATQQTVSYVLMLHRVLMAIPMIFVGQIIKRGYKKYYILFLIAEGFLIAIPGFIKHFATATIVWLLHDFFGAGLWLPIQSALILRYSSSRSRGMELGKVVAFSSITLALGPVLAGYLSSLPGLPPETAIALPFVAGGLIIVASALPLFLL